MPRRTGRLGAWELRRVEQETSGMENWVTLNTDPYVPLPIARHTNFLPIKICIMLAYLLLPRCPRRLIEPPPAIIRVHFNNSALRKISHIY